MCIAQNKTSKGIGFTDVLRKLITTHRLLPSCSLVAGLQPEASLEEWDRSTGC